MIAVAAILGCGREIAPNAADRAAAPTTQPFKLPRVEGVDILDVVSHVEGAIFRQWGRAPSVVVELKAHFSTAGRYSIGGRFDSLADLASSLEAQVPEYRWQVVGDGRLVVKPAVGALLDEAMPSVAFGREPVCDVLRHLSHVMEPAFRAPGGCEVRRDPMYLSQDERIALDQAMVTLTASGGTVQDALVATLEQLPVPVGFTLGTIWQGMPRNWQFRW
jgi:hypothetical protein